MADSSLPRRDAKLLLERLQQTLTDVGLDYKRIVDEFGQVRASEQRAQGKTFKLVDHIRGLILSLLSNQRPWGPIARNIDHIAGTFLITVRMRSRPLIRANSRSKYARSSAATGR
jgi:hypothetical protein